MGGLDPPYDRIVNQFALVSRDCHTGPPGSIGGRRTGRAPVVGIVLAALKWEVRDKLGEAA